MSKVVVLQILNFSGVKDGLSLLDQVPYVFLGGHAGLDGAQPLWMSACCINILSRRY